MPRPKTFALILLVLGAAVTLVAASMGLQRALDDRALVAMSTTAQAAAPADRQAGDRIGLAGPVAPAGAPVPQETANGSASAPPVLAAPPALAPPDVQAARATAVHIPRLKVDRSLVGLSVQPNGSLSVPASRHDVGWWSDGPRPGGAGATLLAGHVNLKSGPGVFANLKDMRVGDRVSVDRADGTTAVFQVVGKASYPRANFPDDVVYRQLGKPSLHLVTCDGAINRSTGLYQDNLVVFADLVSAGPTKKTGR